MLERYPPKLSGARPPGVAATPLAGRPAAATPAPVPPAAGPPRALGPPGKAPEGLIRLERPFDVDEFSGMLGETAIRVTVPPEALAEVLRRVVEFMGFGIYVYAITVRPAPSELLKGFVVELQRVDFDPGAKGWKPFVERGAVGPSAGGPPA